MKSVLLRTSIFGAVLALASPTLFDRQLIAEDSGSSDGANDSLQEAQAGQPINMSIPLSSIITTSPQKGLIHTREFLAPDVTNRQSKQTSGYLRQILQNTSGGASNIFLVDAVDEHTAIAASFSVVVGSRSADEPVPENAPKPRQGKHWLVAYLGTAPSNPTWWRIDSIDVSEKKISLVYRKSKPGRATRDSRPYYFWVPLGELPANTYELELFDADLKAATLKRRVAIKTSRVQ